MRLLFLCSGSRGDYEPLLAVAVALQALEEGAELHVAAHPCFAAQTRAHGCRFHPLRPGVSFAEQLKDAEAAARAVFGGGDRSLPGLLVANWFSAPPGFSLAQFFRVNCLFLWPGAPLTRTRAYGCPLLPVEEGEGSSEARLRAWALFDASLWLSQQKPLNAWRTEQLSLPPLPTGVGGGVASLRVPTVYALSAAILPRPADWPARCLLSGAWQLRPDPAWRPPTDVLEFVTARDAPPVLCAGFGAAPQAALPLLTSVLIRAAHSSGMRLILLGGGAEGGLSAPSDSERGVDVLWTDAYLPHHWLLPRCWAAICHGGAGTVNACLSAGTPQILMPLQFDQPWWADRMRTLGVAPCGPLPLPDAADGGAKVSELLLCAIRRVSEPGVRARAAQLARELAAEVDGAGFAAEFLRQYAQTPLVE